MHVYRRKVIARLGAVIVAALVATLSAVPLSADAHDYAVSSTPADGAVITELPPRFTLTMNKDMLDLSGAGRGFALQILGADGLYYGDGCVTVTGPTLSTPADLGAPGEYRMRWQIVSADGHPVSDEYDFTWAPATATADEAAGAAAAPECGVPATTAEAPPSAAPDAGALDPDPADHDTDTDTDTDTRDPAPAASTTPVPTSSASDAVGPALWIGGGTVLLAALIAAMIIARRRRRSGPS